MTRSIASSEGLHFVCELLQDKLCRIRVGNTTDIFVSLICLAVCLLADTEV